MVLAANGFLSVVSMLWQIVVSMVGAGGAGIGDPKYDLIYIFMGLHGHKKQKIHYIS